MESSSPFCPLPPALALLAQQRAASSSPSTTTADAATTAATGEMGAGVAPFIFEGVLPPANPKEGRRHPAAPATVSAPRREGGNPSGVSSGWDRCDALRQLHQALGSDVLPQLSHWSPSSRPFFPISKRSDDIPHTTTTTSRMAAVLPFDEAMPMTRPPTVNDVCLPVPLVQPPGDARWFDHASPGSHNTTHPIYAFRHSYQRDFAELQRTCQSWLQFCQHQIDAATGSFSSAPPAVTSSLASATAGPHQHHHPSLSRSEASLHPWNHRSESAAVELFRQALSTPEHHHDPAPHPPPSTDTPTPMSSSSLPLTPPPSRSEASASAVLLLYEQEVQQRRRRLHQMQQRETEMRPAEKEHVRQQQQQQQQHDASSLPNGPRPDRRRVGGGPCFAHRLERLQGFQAAAAEAVALVRGAGEEEEDVSHPLPPSLAYVPQVNQERVRSLRVALSRVQLLAPVLQEVLSKYHMWELLQDGGLAFHGAPPHASQAAGLLLKQNVDGSEATKGRATRPDDAADDCSVSEIVKQLEAFVSVTEEIFQTRVKASTTQLEANLEAIRERMTSLGFALPSAP